MTFNTQKLRKVAESANGFAGGDVAEWPLTAKSHIRSLASTVIQCADTIDTQAAELARLRTVLAGLIAVCEPNIYPQPDKPNSAWAKLVAARAALQEKSNER